MISQARPTCKDSETSCSKNSFKITFRQLGFQRTSCWSADLSRSELPPCQRRGLNPRWVGCGTQVEHKPQQPQEHYDACYGNDPKNGLYLMKLPNSTIPARLQHYALGTFEDQKTEILLLLGFGFLGRKDWILSLYKPVIVVVIFLSIPLFPANQRQDECR